MKNNIKVERAVRDITQQELAEAVGVSRRRSIPLRPEDMFRLQCWR